MRLTTAFGAKPVQVGAASVAVAGAAGGEALSDAGAADFTTAISCWMFVDGVDLRPSSRVLGTVVAWVTRSPTATCPPTTPTGATRTISRVG